MNDTRMSKIILLVNYCYKKLTFGKYHSRGGLRYTINTQILSFRKGILALPTSKKSQLMHIHNLGFSADYRAQSPLFMFEFDSHLCFLLCYPLKTRSFLKAVLK